VNLLPDWIVVILAFITGNFFKPFFGEFSKDFYRYAFKGGKELKRKEKQKSVLLNHLKNTKGVTEVHNIQKETYPEMDVEEVEDLLIELDHEYKRVKRINADNVSMWTYITTK